MKIKGYFPGRVKNNGYISPPLQIPRTDRNSGSTRWTIALLLCVLLILYLCGFNVPGYRGGNKKVVIILAANLGGGNTPFGIALMTGVLNVKNSGDWAIEKWSIRNKKDYAARHGMLAPGAH
jgi:hypothetical protein